MSRTRSSIVIFLTKALSLGLQLLAVRFYLENLGETLYGTYLFALTLAPYFNLLDVGIAPAAIKLMSEREALQDREGMLRLQRAMLAFQLVTACALIVIGTILLVVPAAWLKLDTPTWDLRWIFVVVNATFVLTILANTLTALFQANRMFPQIALRDGLVSAIGAAASIAVVITTKSPLGLAITLCATAAVSVLTISWLTVRTFGTSAIIPAWHGPTIRDLYRFAAQLYLPSNIRAIARTLDKLLIPVGINITALAPYNVAYKIPWSLLGILSPSFAPVLPHLAREQALSIDRFSKEVDRLSRMLMGVSLALIVIPCAFGGPLLNLWLGPSAPASGEWMVLLLGISCGMELYGQTFGQAIVARAKPLLELPFNILEIILIGAMTVPVARTYGLVGVAAGLAVISVIKVPVMVIYFRGAIMPSFPLRNHLLKAASALALGCLLAAGCFLLCRTPAFQQFPILALPAIPIAAIIAVALVYALGLCDVPDPLLNRLPAFRKLRRG
jgi:O-antigen/teichoic acid export membrane protein